MFTHISRRDNLHIKSSMKNTTALSFKHEKRLFYAKLSIVALINNCKSRSVGVEKKTFFFQKFWQDF